MFRTTKEFYTSKKWDNFRHIVIDNNTDADGYCICSVCGKPIINKYDLIVHHKIELSNDNVNDYNISLNPDNCTTVHFKCHNKIHSRFDGAKGHSTKPKKVYIVYGAPCSGKTTWVKDNANETDIIIDINSIYQMITINNRYVKPDAVRSVVFSVQNHLYDIVRFRDGKWQNAFIITGGARIGDRERLSKRVGADELIFIDTDELICLNRAADRGDDWIRYVKDWFEAYQA